MHKVRFLLGAMILALAACGSVEPVRECEPVGRARPVCGMQSPEDLAVLPGGRELIVSQFGAMDGHRAGSIAAFDLATDALRVLYAGGVGESAVGWGDADCPGPPGPEFSPHGIDLATRPDGALQLLVVNHGGREAIELFQVATGPVRLTWRGCAVGPEGTLFNEVAALPDGGFVATHMFPNRGAIGSIWEFARAGLLGMKTGHVLEWQRGAGFSKVPGSDDVIPNGVAVAPDGASIYVNSSGRGTVRRIERATGREISRAEVPSPDNVTWGEGGRLLVASLPVGLGELMSCTDLEGGACPVAFAIFALDPETMETRELYANEGAPMGAGTSAVEVNGELFIGSFTGDRLLRVTPGD